MFWSIAWGSLSQFADKREITYMLNSLAQLYMQVNILNILKTILNYVNKRTATLYQGYVCTSVRPSIIQNIYCSYVFIALILK